MKKISFIALSVLLLLTLVLAACAQPAPAPAPAPAPKPAPAPSKPTATTEVTILHLSDLTGRAKSINIPASAMAEAFVREINEVEGGIFGKKGGVKLKLMVADTNYDVAKAKESWARAKEEKAKFIVAFHLMSGLAEGMIDDSIRDQIPMVCGSWGLKGPWNEWYYGAGHPGLPDCTATEGILGAFEIAKAEGKPKPTKIGTMSSALPFEPMFFIGNEQWIKTRE